MFTLRGEGFGIQENWKFDFGEIQPRYLSTHNHPTIILVVDMMCMIKIFSVMHQFHWRTLGEKSGGHIATWDGSLA